jgi:flagellar motor protein MotB
MRDRRIRQEDEEAEGYFASVSDLMVGILFIFLLMLTVFALNFRQAEQEQLVRRQEYEAALAALDQQRKETEVQRQEATRQRNAAELKERQNTELRGLLREALARLERDLREREQARQSLLVELEQQLHSRGIQVVVDQRSGVLRLAGDLLFSSGSAALSGDALRTVRALADALAHTLPCYASDAPASDCPNGALPVLETVLIEGHTDHRPFTDTSRYRDNDQLSTERALAVFTEVRRAQPVLDSLRNGMGLQLLGASGYGDRRPLADAQGTTEDDFKRNRRIDIRFVLTARTSDELQRLRDTIRQAIGEP